MFIRLSLPTQTLIAELIGEARYLESSRKLGMQGGSFSKKSVKGTYQYYFKYYAFSGKRRECYIGSDSDSTHLFIKKHKEGAKHFLEEKKRVRELTKMVIAGGVIVFDRSTYSIIEALGNQGVFRSGGVLIGTQAFIAICNLLAINPTGTGMKTHDIDIVKEKRITVAAGDTPISVVDTLTALNMGFTPIPPFNHKEQPTSYRSKTGISIDFMVPMTGKHKVGVVKIPTFGVHAQPLRYLDFLIEETIDAPVSSNSKTVLVVVPDPSRFAFHKLIVASKRPVIDTVKIAKDVAQAAVLFEFLLTERPDDLEATFQSLKDRGKNWVKNFAKGLNKMHRKNPKIAKTINDKFLG
ncbi:MAG: hypothetical protein HQL68_11550 [Magnetococcales bacterium]|nr:hypothetical protein [Magnetococcales bacterium]